jgi:signal peptidase I
MEPAILSNSTVLVEKFSYLFRKPKKGEIIIFYSQPLKKFLIKRIDKVIANEYFVLGDNLLSSIDSRHFGKINKKDIIGQVFKVYKK